MPVSKACVGVWALAGSLAIASDLPVRVYSAADGLRSNSVNRIVTDSRGFLWLSTSDGAARFDGYQFLNFSVGEGLSTRRVNDVLESRAGDVWVATGEGLCRLGKRPPPAAAVDRVFDPPGPHWVSRLLEARTSTATDTVIWCGTRAGLYRFTPHDGRFERLPLTSSSPSADAYIHDLYEDRSGALWVGTELGLYRVVDGRVTARYTVEQGLPANQVTAVREDRTGALWIATFVGAARMVNGRVDLVLRRANGLAADYLYSVLPLANGDVWLGGTGGVTVLDSSGTVRRRIRGADGLVVDDVESIAQDPDGNIWLGTDGAGAVKIAQTGFTTWSDRDGILGRPSALLEAKDGGLVLLTKTHDRLRLYGQEDGNFRLLRTIGSGQSFGWGAGQVALHGARDDWWITTSAGLFRFAPSAEAAGLARGKETLVTTGPAGSAAPLKIFEDSRGDLWMGFLRGGGTGLARWRRSTGTLEPVLTEGSPAPSSFPFVFAEDRAGAVWVGYFQGQLMRYSSGHLREVPLPARAARGIRSLLLDSRGRMWVGTSEAGLLRFDHPEEERPSPAEDARQPALSGDLIQCLAEDGYGRIYACNTRGVDALDPVSNRLRHYTAEDGLVKGDLQMTLRDREGALWFASPQGVSRLIPQPDRQAVGPYVQVSRLDVGGVPQGISRLGENRVSGLRLPFGAGPVRIEVIGVNFRPGDVLRYETRLAGVEDWTPASPDRAFSYLALPPGTYRFQARAVNADGAASSAPAEVEFTVLAPVWRRWWFLSLAGVAVAGAAISAHRIRLARLMAIERVRNRIAGDLHDDIGSTLSQIAVLSEVAKRESDGAAHTPLGRISELSGQVLESMSDIVWAIHPARDRSADLIQRMRHFASELFTAAEIDLSFQVEAAFDGRPFDPELRRELLLMFKEAANNVVRHAAARRVSIRVWSERDSFGFDVSDDGRGFDRQDLSGEGHGLAGIERRARALRGQSSIESRPGAGTVVRVEVPTRRRARAYLKR